MAAVTPYLPNRTTFPQLWLLVPLCAGLWLGHALYEQCAGLLLPISIGTAVCIALALLLRLWRHGLLRVVATVAFLLAVVGSGLLLMIAAEGHVRTDWPDKAQTYAVRNVSLPRQTTRSIGVEAEVIRGEYSGKRIKLYLPDSVPLAVGDAMWIYARIENPKPSGNPYDFDWGGYLHTQGVSGTAYAFHSAPMREESRPNSLRLWALKVQHDAVERLGSYFEGTDFAMLAAMTVGDKRGLNSEVREVFSETGTSHLLALSGLHLGILFGFFQFLVVNRVQRRRYRFVAVGLGLLLVWLYALVAGMPLSMQRAATMLSFAQILQLGRRDAMGLDRLLVAALLLLVVSPMSLFDVGFQLSFLSVAAILWFVPLFPSLSVERNRLLRMGYDMLLVSLSAWIGTMPVVAYYFHTIGIYTLPANLIAVTLAYPLLLLCAFFFAVPPLSAVLAPCIKVLLSAITGTLQFFADLPGSTLHLYPTLCGTFIALAFLLAASVWLRRRVRFFGVCAVVFLCALIGEETWAHRPGRLQPQLVFYNLWRGSGVQAIRNDGTSYLWTHGDGTNENLQTAAREFWERENIKPSVPLDTAYRDSFLHYSPPLLSFGGKRVALLCDKQPKIYDTKTLASQTKGRDFEQKTTNIPVDYILVTKGYSGKPAQSLQRYPHGTVVLDASLGTGYRSMWHTAADSLHRPIHDMERDGALIVKIGNQ